MATSATGTVSTLLSIPKINTAVDPPDGKGINSIVDFLDSLIVPKPTGILTNETVVWNGTTWVRSSVTPLTTTSIGSGSPASGKYVDGATGAWTTLPVTSTVYDRVVAAVDIQNSVAETSIYTKAIAAGDMSTNKSLRLTMHGDVLHNNGAGDSITFKVKFGGTTHINIAHGFNSVSAARQPFKFVLMLSNLTATSQFGTLELLSLLPGSSAPTTGIGQSDVIGTGSPPWGGLSAWSAASAIDTTSVQTLDITGTWSSASANNSWRTRYSLLELL